MSVLIALLLLAPPPDEVQPNPYLQQARELYEQLDFEKCLLRIKQASLWKTSSKDELRDVEIFGALCALNLGQKAEAAERFKLALRIDEGADLPEFASPKAVKLFMQVKRSLHGPVPPMPDEDLPSDTPERAKLEPRGEAPPVEVTAPSRFPVKPLPLVLGGTALAALVAGIALGTSAKGLESQAGAQTFESDFLALRSQALTLTVLADVLFGVAGAAAVGAVVAFITQRAE